MQLLKGYLLAICCFLLVGLQAQEDKAFSFSEAEQEIEALAVKVVTDSLVENRVAANKQLKAVLQKTLEQPTSFQYPFSEIQSLSIQMPADSAFRIFTWQLFVDNNTYQYGGLIQVNGETPKLFPLTDYSADIDSYDIEFETLSAEEWYGALYYNVQEFDTLDQKKYLLFGFDGFQFFHKRKLVEVLSFDEEGTPVFGAPVFAKEIDGQPSETKNRLYAEYDASIAVRLNYDPNMEIIIQDHLMQMRGQYRGQGMVNVPDGSYEGYYFKEGMWRYKEKIFDLISEEPPRPNPILTDDKRTIFGKEIKKKKN